MKRINKERHEQRSLTKDDIEFILTRAVESLFENQPDINNFTSETRQTEWNMAHHLANEISRMFPGYSCDLDVTKRNFENRRPDIIIHRRGIHDHNCLIIELKRYGRKTELYDDMQKIVEYWFSAPLSYRFGAIIDLRSESDSTIEVLQNQKLSSRYDHNV